MDADRPVRHGPTERRTVARIDRDAPDADFVIETPGGRCTARHVVLACGYRDVYPDIDGFDECWAHTIIPCPFCDGYENRDRRWGIVPAMVEEPEVFPSMVRNWTSELVVIAPRSVEDTAEQPTTLVTDLVERLGLALDAHGHVAVDDCQRTNIDRLWAAGDIQGWTGAIEAATLGSMVGAMIVHDWYASQTVAAA